MKNPFEKDNHTALIAGVIIGSALAGTATYLFLTETGASVRDRLTGHLHRLRDQITGTRSEPVDNHHTDYMHHKQKAPKTDREKLLKHEILNDSIEGTSEHDQQS